MPKEPGESREKEITEPQKFDARLFESSTVDEQSRDTLLEADSYYAEEIKRLESDLQIFRRFRDQIGQELKNRKEKGEK